MEVYTIRDVARKAGVAVSTVSRVLNGKPDVSETTRRRVLEIVEECGFVQNGNARSLKQAKTEFAAIIVRGQRSAFLGEVQEQMLTFAKESQTPFIVEHIDEEGNEFDTMRRLYTEKGACGFILLGSRLDERSEAVRALGLPCVFATVNASKREFQSASSVSIDDSAAACAMMDRLLDNGHTSVAILGGNPEGDDPIARRFQGALQSLAAHGIPFDTGKQYRQVRFSLADAYECTKRLFKTDCDVTAVFAMSDMIAAGVIRALRDLGLRVPEDVSVTGFDGTEMAQYYIPSIATVRQPVEDIARESVKLLLNMMKGNQPRHVTVEYALVEGESVAQRASSN